MQTWHQISSVLRRLTLFFSVLHAKLNDRFPRCAGCKHTCAPLRHSNAWMIWLFWTHIVMTLTLLISVLQSWISVQNSNSPQRVWSKFVNAMQLFTAWATLLLLYKCFTSTRQAIMQCAVMSWAATWFCVVSKLKNKSVANKLLHDALHFIACCRQYTYYKAAIDCCSLFKLLFDVLRSLCQWITKYIILLAFTLSVWFIVK